MQNRIKQRLMQAQAEENVKILYACESGSRAWGFPSADSDYDVRFIYIRPADFYLSIDLASKSEVLEYPINDELDVAGWDLPKALRLFRKSNPPLLEWLDSPIVYHRHTGLADRLRALAPTHYNPVACAYHYWHMAEGNYREHLKGDTVWVKEYFYVLRPILAVKWIEQNRGPVPTRFQRLVDELIAPSPLKDAIARLLADKQSGCELDRGPRIPAISDFVDAEIARHTDNNFDLTPQKGPIEPLNELFRRMLNDAWQ